MTLFTEPPHLYLTLIFIHACNYLTISQDILSSDYTHLSTNIEFILFLFMQIQLVTDDYSKSIEKILKVKTDELSNA